MRSRGRSAIVVALLALVAAAAPVGAADWVTYHHDARRGGLDSQDPGFVAAALDRTSPSLTGAVYAEPLVYGNTVYVATEGNLIYALDAATLAVQWSVTLPPPVPLSVVHAATGSNCGNINPLGITGTPVIDPGVGSAGTLFAVAETWDGNANSPHVQHRLFELDLATHGVTAASADPPGLQTSSTSPESSSTGLEQQRGALALSSGRVIVPYGGMAGDCGRYHGYAVSLDEGTMAVAGTYETVPDFAAAGLWAASGPAVDGNGNVFVSSGNAGSLGGCSTQPQCGSDNSAHEDSESVVRLSSTMARLDAFTPANWQALNDTDTDVGSVGPMLVDGGLVFQVGKEGVGYLLHKDALGGVGGQAFSARVCTSNGDAAFGGTAYAAGMILVPCRDGLVALRLNAGSATFTQAWYEKTGMAHPPIVAGGAAWTVIGDTLYAMDLQSGAHRVSVAIANSGANAFMTPAAGNGRVYVGSYSGSTGHVTSVQMTPVLVAAGAAGAFDQALYTLNPSRSGYAGLGGQLAGAPAVAAVAQPSGPANPLYVVTGTDQQLYTYDGPHRAFSHLGQPSVGCIDNPAAATLGAAGSQQLVVACEGTDGALWWAQVPVASDAVPATIPATAFRSLGGQLTAGPAVTFLPGDSLPTFYVDGTDDHHVWQITPGGSWTAQAWRCLGHPAAATNPARSAAFFACQGLDRHLWYVRYTAGGGWTGLSADLSSILVDGPGIAATTNGTVFFVEGSDTVVYEATLAGGVLTRFRGDGGQVQFGMGAAGLA